MKRVHVGGILPRSQNKAAKKKGIKHYVHLHFRGDLYRVSCFL